jgi:hypothetical protein
MKTTNRMGALLTVIVTGAGLAACGGGGGGGGSTTPISVAFSSPLPGSLSISDTASLTAIVSNDPSFGGVTWSASCAATDCGSFNPGSSSTNTPTIYTPPASLPNPASVTITATSAANRTKSASGAITLTAPAAPLLSDGTYVFHASGIDVNGAYSLAGAFKVAGGVIVSGEQDFSDPNLGSNDPIVASGSGLRAAGGNIQIILATGNSAIGINGVETFRGTVVSTARVLLSQFDNFATATGSLDLQTASSAPSGGYAFAVQGNDTGSGNPLVMGGILSFTGSALDAGASVFDVNDGGTVLQKQSFESGSVSAPDEFGRVVLDLVPSSASSVAEVKFSAYVVGPARLQLVESQADTLNANLGGTALGQGTNAGQFTLAGVAGSSYAHGTVGVEANANGPGPLTLAGGFGLNADGTVGGRMAFADNNVHQGNSISGTYTIDPTGRVTLNQIVLSTTGVTLNFQLYLDGEGNGLLIGVDSFQVTQGLAYAQVSGQPLGGAYALSAQGIASSGTFSAVGPVSVVSGTFSGMTDYNNDGSPQPATPLNGSQDLSNGTLQLTGLSGDTTTQSGWGYYPIDSSRTLAIEVDGQQLGLLFLEAVSP